MGFLDFLQAKKANEQPKQEIRHASDITPPVAIETLDDFTREDWDGSAYISWWDDSGPHLKPLAQFYCAICNGHYLPHEH